MKINPDFEIISDNKLSKNKPATGLGEKSFKDVLNASTENKGASDCSGVQHTGAGLGINAVQFTPPQFEKAQLAERLDHFINLLEDYKIRLEDPGSTLRDIDPIVKKMDMEKNRLEKIQNTLADGDAVKPILNHALIDGSKEIVKFNSGYYIDR